ncbi:hypothetical protein [Amorphus sp. MBR-141]
MKRNNENVVVLAVLTGAVLFTAPLAIAETLRSDRLEPATVSEDFGPVSPTVRIGSISHAGNESFVVALLNEAGQKIGDTRIRPSETVLIKDGPSVTARPSVDGDPIAKTNDRISGGMPANVSLKSDKETGQAVTFEAYQPRASEQNDSILKMAKFGEIVHQRARSAVDKALNWI